MKQGQEFVYATKQAVDDATEHQVDHAIAQARNHAIGQKSCFEGFYENHFLIVLYES
jgi:hypothetical protein